MNDYQKFLLLKYFRGDDFNRNTQYAINFVEFSARMLQKYMVWRYLFIIPGILGMAILISENIITM